MSPLLTVRNVSGGYGAVRILHDVTLTVAAGGITALVGANGAGKTTLMRTLAGLLPVGGGELAFDGAAIGAWSSSRRVSAGCVLVPEGRMIFPEMSVEENLRIGAIVPPARPHVAARLERVYALFPRLAERRAQVGGTLSGGEQQMLAIGRGLMAGPRLLMLDEPTLGLAPMMATMVFQTLQRLRAEGLTILLAEQDVRRTLDVADTAYVMENGRTTLSGPAVDLRDDPRIISAYLGA